MSFKQRVDFMEINKIYQGDCLELMKQIKYKSVDMVLCDLPYGTTACKWDTIIDLELLWKQYNRIIKDDGAIILTSSQPFTTILISSNLSMFREEIIWLKNKSGSGLQAKQKHIKVHESILIFSKNGKYKFNPQKWFVDKKEFLTQRKTLSNYGAGNNIYGSMEMKRKKDDGTRNPLSIISCKIPHNPCKTKKYNKNIDLRLHPTQKPLKLGRYLVKTYTNKNDLVLDNTCGVGSFLLSAKLENRNFIGIELDEKYCEIARNRVKDVQTILTQELGGIDNE